MGQTCVPRIFCFFQAAFLSLPKNPWVQNFLVSIHFYVSIFNENLWIISLNNWINSLINYSTVFHLVRCGKKSAGSLKSKIKHKICFKILDLICDKNISKIKSISFLDRHVFQLVVQSCRSFKMQMANLHVRIKINSYIKYAIRFCCVEYPM